MTTELWGLVVWGIWGALFAAFELTSVFWDKCPWPTLSEFFWNLEGRSHWVSIILLAGLVVLLVHIVFGPSGPAG